MRLAATCRGCRTPGVPDTGRPPRPRALPWSWAETFRPFDRLWSGRSGSSERRRLGRATLRHGPRNSSRVKPRPFIRHLPRHANARQDYMTFARG